MSRSNRAVTAVAVCGLFATALVTLPAAAGAQTPAGVRPVGPSDQLNTSGHNVRGVAPDVTPYNNTPPPAPKWPAAGTAIATVPVQKGAAKVAAADAVKVEVVDRTKVAARWRDGLVVKAAPAVASKQPARLSVSYDSFRYAQGGDWASRLKLWKLPACAVTTPDAAGCEAAEVPSTNDTKTGKVTAALAPSSLAAGTFLALDTAPEGPDGDYKATSLAASSTWSSGGSTGDFTWSYPMRTPPAIGGAAPTVGLAYSSSSVDGRTSATNNQPSVIGEGFEYSPGFIERQYLACYDDKKGSTNDKDSGDRCWRSDNAVLNLDGHASELILDKDDVWRSRSDDGSVITKLPGADNGDDNGEHWKVTAANGTQYFFGLNKLPGQTDATSSTFTTRVYGNKDKEPCYDADFAKAHCNQAWRWNLDYVVDVRGNTMSYWYDRDWNAYGANLKKDDVVPYVRGGFLKRIDYGTWDRGDSDRSTTARAQVVFTSADRCKTGADCSKHTAGSWPDVPWDQECKTDATTCDNFSPTFWSTRRLAKVTTKVWDTTVTPNKWQDVDSWTMTHDFPSPQDGTHAGLWLSSIVHAGLVGGEKKLPPVTFSPTTLPNRVLTAHNRTDSWQRMGKIISETGAKTTITYNLPDCTADDTKGIKPESNTRLCYPVIGPNPSDADEDDITEWWLKYRVDQVAQSDVQLDSSHQTPIRNTYYKYVGAPAWHYADDDGFVRESRKTWSDFRGYGEVETRVGDAGSPRSLTVTSFLRGMHGDRRNEAGDKREVIVDATLGDEKVYDEDQFAGQVREQTVYNGSTSKPVSKTVNVPWRSPSHASRTINGDTAEARFINTRVKYASTALGVDGKRGWRTTRQENWFDGDDGTLTKMQDVGDVAVTGDEQCASYTYNNNTKKNLIGLKQQVVTKVLTCDKDVASTDDVLSDTRYFYDGATDVTTDPKFGSVTRTDELKNWTKAGGTEYRTVGGATFDAFGRADTQTDERGNKSALTYEPANAPAAKITTTTGAPYNWKTEVGQAPYWDLPTTTVNLSGGTSRQEYDPLGRLSKVWAVGWSYADHKDTPSSTFDYVFSDKQTDYPYVVTSALNAGGKYSTSYAIYDGFLRPRQTQIRATDGNRIVTDTIYDEYGNEVKSYQPHAAEGAPSGQLWWAPEWSLRRVQQTIFDLAGRATDVIDFAGDGETNLVEKWRTHTSYEGDLTRVTPPKGGTAQTNVVDAQGRTRELRVHTTADGVDGAFDKTLYTYNRKNQLTDVVDVGKNRWTTKFDILGRVESTTDPDRGTTKLSYNEFGDLVSTVDAENRSLITDFDALGRPFAQYNGSKSADNLRTEWKYDVLYTGQPAPSQLTQTIRYDNKLAYKTQIVSFNARNQATGVNFVIPGGETGLGGTYTYGYGFSPFNGDGESVTFPKAGDLPAEKVVTAFSGDTGLASKLTTNLPGVDSYVTLQEYSKFGEPTVTQRKITGEQYVQNTTEYDIFTRRTSRMSVKVETATGTSLDRRYDYDAAGNILHLLDVPETGAAEKQCFAYDKQQRLVSAWTPDTAVSCQTAPSAAALAGPASYWTDWTIDNLGNRRVQTSHSLAQDTTTTYAVPEPGDGVVQPHAVTTATTAAPGVAAKTAAYKYDKTGSMISRPGATGATQELTWDAAGKLTKIMEGAAQTTNVYDDSGNRLVHRDTTGSTVYLPDMELTRRAGASSTAATRYYTFNGSIIGSRTGPGGLQWTYADHQGTQVLVVNAANQQPTARRQSPYGEPRGGNQVWPSLKGFVGGDSDTSGLTHIGAREYDPVLGRFISVDPLMDMADPQQWNGYAYSNNTPVTMSDPSGEHGSASCAPGMVGNGQGCDGHENSGGSTPPPQTDTDEGEVTLPNGTTYDSNYDGNGNGSINGVAFDLGGNHTTSVKEMALALDRYKGDHPPSLPGVIDQDDNDHTLKGIFSSWMAGYLKFRGEREKTFDWWQMVMTIHAWNGLLALGGDGSMHPIGPMARPGGKGQSGGIKIGKAGGCKSFSGDTQVLLKDGSSKAFKYLRPGDEVLSTDPVTGEQGGREIEKVWVHDDDLFVLTIDGRRLVTTEDHPFWNATAGRWERADELGAGDRLRTSSGAGATVDGLDLDDHRYAAAYNLTVKDLHTYYVLADGVAVLVHNDGLGDNINLYGDYTARMDQFNVRGQASFEVHVYHRGSEVGIYGSNGFFNKHGVDASKVDVPQQVHNRLKGIAIDKMRKTGQLPQNADVKGDAWKRPMVGSTAGRGC
ncbi:polymorphic toxin-type HINT domain-containing protein [Actinoplanes friuliensis]|uniref:Rhs family protein-like protein n=1 Tax=Actinoplanes friuliensis DSM 7358 TaxID=1246995 RepID=U5WAS0_9ACTN|nr:polymorphic toxin-type HINT domain-containing protein [Actinoplanes friuliensis]AGZ46087.1 Rhs family protein-like protein [Actinoplanes friuliensis DSM 7358]